MRNIMRWIGAIIAWTGGIVEVDWWYCGGGIFRFWVRFLAFSRP